MRFRKGGSLFGITTTNYNGPYPFPTASEGESVPSGGLYGEAKFSYSQPEVKLEPSGSQ